MAAAGLLVLGLIGCADDGQMAVVGINPPAGHIGGEQTVEIAGKNFRTDIGYTVFFGNQKAKAVTIRSKEALTVTTPSGSVGPVDVTIRADDGNAFLMKQAFKYEDMGGSVVEGLGESGKQQKQGNLPF
jgi:hypothetical protein